MVIDTNGTRPRVDLSEVGITGIVKLAGQIEDEILPELRGTRRIAVIKSMIANDATIGALLFTLKMLIRQVDWRIESASEDNIDTEAAKFMDECLFQDMSTSWKDTLSDIVSLLAWGYSWEEIVWKYRDGESADPSRRSRFTDGRIGIRKLAIRRQETHYAWIFDDDGGVKAFQQVAAPDYQIREIPIEKSLLFRTENAGGNPEGYSILRNAYRSWRIKTRIENLEGIGIERDLAGLPVAYLPPEYMSANASAAQAAVYAEVKRIVTSIRNDEQGGIVMPMSYDANGHQNFDIKLLSTGGARQFDIDKTITRYDHRILASVLADFIMLGSANVGSFALSDNKTDLFAVAVGAWLDNIASVINMYLIPRLIRLNSFRVEKMPRITHGDIETPDLIELADYVSKAITAGALTPDATLEAYIRHAANLPELPVDTGVAQ